ncbi:MAG: hypothetical protein FJ276_12855 [Planctomycetes bacterium]|nr:hypothetical protein [Planctomycetota bacterium]
MPSGSASGTEELLIAMQTPAPRGHLGVPTLLWGQPGEGKTSFVESLDRPGFPVVTLIASIHDPTDFSGLPVYEQQRMRFAPPEWTTLFDDPQEGILFLDELTTAPPAVQAALLRIVLERKVGIQSLPERVRIVAAANPPEDIVGGWELSPPLANRFVHIRWKLSGIALAESFQDGFARPELPAIDPDEHREAAGMWRLKTAAFLRRDPTLVHTVPAEREYAFASPRTWDFAVQLMASCELLGKAAQPGKRASTVFYNLLEGAIGSGAARSFTGYLKDLCVPNPDRVLDGKESVHLESLKDDELYILFCSLCTGVANRRRQLTATRFLKATMILLSLIEDVDAAGRVDTVFAPVRQLVRGQLLQHAASAAQNARMLGEYEALVHRLFDDTALSEYVRLLTTPPDPGNK